MGINEEQLELLVGELQKLRKHMAGMLDKSTQSTVTLERIDKTLSNQQKSKSTDGVEASYNPDTNNTDDQQKVVDTQNKLRKQAKLESEELEKQAQSDIASKAAMEAVRIREDQLAAQEESNEGQMQTNDYLRVLAKLTKKNDDRITDGLNGKNKDKVDSDGKPIVDSGAGLLERALVRSGVGGNKITGGAGGVLTGLREMGMNIKRGKDKITGIGSNRRQKNIKKETSLINRDKSILSAETDKINKLRANGVGELNLTENKTRINELKETLQGRSEKFGDLTATEHMYQKGRADKNFRKMSKSDRSLLIEQTKGNIAKSVMQDVNGLDNKTSATKPLIKNSNGNFPLNTNSKSNTGDKKENHNLFNTSLTSSSNPNTYGEYITGIYDELENLNNKESVTQVSSSKSSSGGFISSLLGGLGSFIVAGIGSMLLKKGAFGILGKTARNAKALKLKTLRSTKAGREVLKVNNARKAAKLVKSSKSAGSFIAREAAAKAAAKAATTKAVSKSVGKSFLKKIPGIGLILGLGLAGMELSKGNYGRAILQAGSGALSTIPGLGTLGSVAVDGALLADTLYHPESNNDTNKRKQVESTRHKKAMIPNVTKEQAGETRRALHPKVSVSNTQSANSRESMAMMQLQATLTANALGKVMTSNGYTDTQTKIAKQQGKAVADATFA